MRQIIEDVENYERLKLEDLCDEGASNLFNAIVKSAVDEYKLDLMVQWLRGASFEEAEGTNYINYDCLLEGTAIKSAAKRTAWEEFQKSLKEDKKRSYKTHTTHVYHKKPKRFEEVKRNEYC